ncbi:FAD-dependent oxidoreductase [Oscillatoria sp. FACHB-1407]|uniref:FAD-dependent oxidoreductase n=1 Tax=Oscillatoria sp. FACHB-1407 TaxID=2692847 RepID=UPI001682FB80|nr:FAD-dependent oxidoreductase [Oscillatoria sp. FACHB-1407]MBD2460258.1 FAD-dependent oxidoreductase [Oscillatoria sp. FACHB-1407]
MNTLTTDVLVVGGGTGGTVAAIQAARRGAQTILVSEFPWLGGMLTSAGVTAPDGNELSAFQTGMWGAFLRELQHRQPTGLNHAWVSFFTYDPNVGAAIFADWVKQLSNLWWIHGKHPQAIERQGDRLVAVHFNDVTIRASIILDGTELGDVLALAEVPHRWGWEWHSQWQEPSAPIAPTAMTEQYPVQAPTWVVVLQDFGEAHPAPEIPAPPIDNPDHFVGTWDGYGAEHFMNYGRLPGNRFMMNFPQRGNDYGDRLDRLIQSPATRQEFLQEARWYAQSYARFLQTHLGRRYGLAADTFPTDLPNCLGGSAYALHPYFRESRRLQGVVTVREQDILPQPQRRVAALPVNAQGQMSAIALGNYANDHHYPGYDFPLKPKSIRWGGRWTGTPFALPYECLIPAAVDGLLVCEKNISVSHIANGATRLQPVVLGIGQAAGMAAALCIERKCQPRDLPVADLQAALLTDPIAPAAIAPLFNLPPSHPDWQHWQEHYLRHPEDYPLDGTCPLTSPPSPPNLASARGGAAGGRVPPDSQTFTGSFERRGDQDYTITLNTPTSLTGQVFQLVTLDAECDRTLQKCGTGDTLTLQGQLNHSGNWLLVEQIDIV